MAVPGPDNNLDELSHYRLQEYQLAFVTVGGGWKEPEATNCLRLHGRKPRILIKGMLQLNLCDVLIGPVSSLNYDTVHVQGIPQVYPHPLAAGGPAPTTSTPCLLRVKHRPGMTRARGFVAKH